MTIEEKEYYKGKIKAFWDKIESYVVCGSVISILLIPAFVMLFDEIQNQKKIQKSRDLTCDCQPIDNKTNDHKTYKCVCKPKQSETNTGSEMLFWRIINNTTTPGR